MEETNFENMEDELCTILCDFEKIATITKVLSRTLIENSDFGLRDTQNLCSILIEEVNNTKVKLNNFEKSLSFYKSSCR